VKTFIRIVKINICPIIKIRSFKKLRRPNISSLKRTLNCLKSKNNHLKIKFNKSIIGIVQAN
jgi:hypothetical protein